MKKLLYVLVLTIMLSAYLPLSAFAANENTKGSKIHLSPEILDKKGKPGETIMGEIEVLNDTKNSIEMTSYVRDFYVTEEDEIKLITTEELKEDPELVQFSLKNWISTSNVDKVFKPGETRKVPVSITIPPDASPGGHYGVLFFAPKGGISEGDIEGSGAALEGEVGSLLTITVEGDFNTVGSIDNFRTGTRDLETKKFRDRLIFWEQGLFEKSKVDFAFRFTNESASHYKPQGFITIKGFFGDKIEEIPVTPSRVFPQTSRNIYTHYEKELLPGIYKAHLVANDAGGRGYDLKTTFIIFPLRIILIILGTILLIVLVAYLYGKHIEKKYQKLGVKIKD